MRIATWNIYSGNFLMKNGLHYLFSYKPDIVSLQEVPYRMLSWLRKHFPEYTLYYTFDFLRPNLKTSTFICLLSKVPVIGSGEFTYSKEKYHSFLSDFVYKLGLNKEQHNVVYIDVLYNHKKYRFQGMRLSCAVGPKVRKFFMRNLLRNKIHNGHNFIVGDLNIPTGKFFNLWAGPFKGNSFSELFIDERIGFNKLIDREEYNNIFSGFNTMDFPAFEHQLDHVLIPKGNIKYDISVSKNGFGSDHKMLFADLDL